MKIVLVTLIAVGLISMNFPGSVAQEVQNACSQAKIDARIDISKAMWVLGGCFLGPLGVWTAYVIESSPRAARFIGKSSDYVRDYTLCYSKEVKRLRGRSAIAGCMVGTPVVGFFIYNFVIIGLSIRAITSWGD